METPALSRSMPKLILGGEDENVVKKFLEYAYAHQPAGVQWTFPIPPVGSVGVVQVHLQAADDAGLTGDRTTSIFLRDAFLDVLDGFEDYKYKRLFFNIDGYAGK